MIVQWYYLTFVGYLFFHDAVTLSYWVFIVALWSTQGGNDFLRFGFRNRLREVKWQLKARAQLVTALRLESRSDFWLILRAGSGIPGLLMPWFKTEKRQQRSVVLAGTVGWTVTSPKSDVKVVTSIPQNVPLSGQRDSTEVIKLKW